MDNQSDKTWALYLNGSKISLSCTTIFLLNRSLQNARRSYLKVQMHKIGLWAKVQKLQDSFILLQELDEEPKHN